MVIDALREVYPWTSHWAPVPKISPKALHYIDEGEGDPMVMLHGNPTWSFYYRELIRHFSKQARVIVPDHIGSGLSEKPENWSYALEDHIQNVIQLVDQLSLKNITLIVHDWGGAIGMGFATRRPELVKRLVILNTGAFYLPDIPKRIQFCRLPFVGEWFVRQLNGFAWPATWMATAKGLPELIKKGYLYPYNSYANRVGVSGFVRDIPLEPDHPSRNTILKIEADLPKVKVPTLILWGAQDFCFHKAFFDRWTQIYPHAKKVWIEDAGHYVLEDARDQVTQEISEFVAAHPLSVLH